MVQVDLVVTFLVNVETLVLGVDVNADVYLRILKRIEKINSTDSLEEIFDPKDVDVKVSFVFCIFVMVFLAKEGTVAYLFDVIIIEAVQIHIEVPNVSSFETAVLVPVASNETVLVTEIGIEHLGKAKVISTLEEVAKV